MKTIDYILEKYRNNNLDEEKITKITEANSINKVCRFLINLNFGFLII